MEAKPTEAEPTEAELTEVIEGGGGSASQAAVAVESALASAARQTVR